MPTHSHMQTGSPAAQHAPRRILIVQSAATIIAGRRARGDVPSASVLARARLCATRMLLSHAHRLHRTATIRTATVRTATRLAQRDKPAQKRVSSPLTVTATTAGPDPSFLAAASGPTALTAAGSPAPMPRTAACSGLMVLALFRAAFAQENPTSAVTLPKRRGTARKHAAHGAAQ